MKISRLAMAAAMAGFVAIAAGAALATPVAAATNPIQPIGTRAAKGRPPAQSGPGTARLQANAATTSGYLYAGADQFLSSDGSWDYMTVAAPYLAASDSHTLAEIAVESADGHQVVEVGWTVDRRLNGDTNPHLFTFHWVNGNVTCYNGCGYVQTSSSSFPGMQIPNGNHEFGIEHFSGKWWIGYNSAWIGYFPDSLWSNSFISAGLIQWFGEVATASTSHPCTDMGNGQWATSGSAASIKVGFFNGAGVGFSTYATTPALYSVKTVASDTFRYGGGGAC